MSTRMRWNDYSQDIRDMAEQIVSDLEYSLPFEIRFVPRKDALETVAGYLQKAFEEWS